MPRLRLPRPRLPRLRRPARISASGGMLIALLLVLTVGTGATAVTAALTNGYHPRALIQPASASAATLPPVTSTPAQVLLPQRQASVAPSKPGHLVSATLLVSGRRSLTPHQLRALRRLSGVRKVQAIAAGRARIGRRGAFVVGVNPASFRPWTPKLTADSNALWASVQRGDVAASFDMGHDANLPLGGVVPVGGSQSVTPMRVGAFASVGMAGVDAVVSKTRARQIGLSSRTGVLISAPKSDPLKLRNEALAIVGNKHARAELLREVIVTRDAGEFLTRVQIVNFLNAAKSRIGRPYVWGAAGPSSFDCSGLVQWSFARAGIRMPRVSEEQWLTGPHVPYADARPGDLLFWHYDPTDPTNIDHVAIYWGNGMMVVAPHTGLDVQYVPVPLSNLAGVVRVDPTLAAELA